MNVGLSYTRAIQEHSGSRIQPHFFSQQIPYRLCEVRRKLQKRDGIRLLRSKRRSKSCSHHARQPLGHIPTQKVQGLHTFSVSPRRDLRCGHGRRAEEEHQVPSIAQWLRCQTRHDPQGVHQESHPHQEHSRCRSQLSRFSCTHIVEKVASDNVVEPDKLYLFSKGYRQNIPC